MTLAVIADNSLKKAQYWSHTVNNKFCYANDIAIALFDKRFEYLEHTLTRGLIAFNNYLKK